MHQPDTRGKAQMAFTESRHKDTALRLQIGNRTETTAKTTQDFHFIQQGDIVAAKPHTLGRSTTNPVLRG